MASSVSEEDPYRPSVFEMVAQDRLLSGLQPAFHYILKVIQCDISI
jgi:hypothetical protein